MDHDPGLIGTHAAAQLNVGVPRFLQLVRESPDRLGRYREGWTDQWLWPRSRVVALRDARNGWDSPEHMTSNEAAAVLGVSRPRLVQLAWQHPTRLGRHDCHSRNIRVLYLRSEVEALAEQRRARRNPFSSR